MNVCSIVSTYKNIQANFIELMIHFSNQISQEHPLVSAATYQTSVILRNTFHPAAIALIRDTDSTPEAEPHQPPRQPLR